MARPRKRPNLAYSRMLHVRLYPKEEAGVRQLAENLGETPSRLIRRLIREALTGGPDYFEDGLVDLRRMQRELASIGRNLNQLTRAANRGQVLNGDDVRRVINAGRVQTAAVEELYFRLVAATVKRAVVPLYEAAGLPSPQGAAGKDQAAEGRGE